ncbi:DUF4439 domain-containing protein [Aeromicrobium phragmitis]|uniref:DUF4439 domain-containing protein n=1 Tax=Aeromicrobium phragmitis TaxID=2478914 RepID=A0A3L8PP75_9ACTN|nr:ferritin-like domain-containing protein [Aeromicrobium phragmitis]RLV56984.1 DUF4439 domain-containing protein [Aeromicrobium phragmitis]
MNEAQAPTWRAWLALELEAVWLYPVIGARHETLRGAAAESFAAHRERRDELVAVFSDANAEPPGPQVSYDVGPLASAEEAADVAQSLESRICAAIVQLVGLVDGDQRAAAVEALREAALRSLSWGDKPEPFPGLD